MWNLKNKLNKQTKLKQTHRHRERTDGCRGGDWMKKAKGLRRADDSYQAVSGT